MASIDRMTGLLLGTAVGDTLGLPREGLSARRASRLYPGPLRQRLVLGRGMLSDDTEHACMTAQALLAAGEDPDRFARALAWKLRWWLLALPAAIGWGTLRAIVRSWIGFAPSQSGVQSAGNGAAMRAPIIGAWLDDPDRSPRGSTRRAGSRTAIRVQPRARSRSHSRLTTRCARTRSMAR